MTRPVRGATEDKQRARGDGRAGAAVTDTRLGMTCVDAGSVASGSLRRGDRAIHVGDRALELREARSRARIARRDGERSGPAQRRLRGRRSSGGRRRPGCGRIRTGRRHRLAREYLAHGLRARARGDHRLAGRADRLTRERSPRRHLSLPPRQGALRCLKPEHAVLGDTQSSRFAFSCVPRGPQRPRRPPRAAPRRQRSPCRRASRTLASTTRQSEGRMPPP
jgi:hypothetical protein